MKVATHQTISMQLNVNSTNLTGQFSWRSLVSQNLLPPRFGDRERSISGLCDICPAVAVLGTTSAALVVPHYCDGRPRIRSFLWTCKWLYLQLSTVKYMSLYGECVIPWDESLQSDRQTSWHAIRGMLWTKQSFCGEVAFVKSKPELWGEKAVLVTKLNDITYGSTYGCNWGN